MRVGPTLWAYLGYNRVGGLVDARFPTLWQREASALRHAAGLPTVDVQGAARYGYDGGRHDQVPVQLGAAGLCPRE